MICRLCADKAENTCVSLATGLGNSQPNVLSVEPEVYTPEEDMMSIPLVLA